MPLSADGTTSTMGSEPGIERVFWMAPFPFWPSRRLGKQNSLHQSRVGGEEAPGPKTPFLCPLQPQ